MKRFYFLISVLLSVLFVLAAVGCSENGKDQTDDRDQEYTITVTESEDYALAPSVTKAKAGTKVDVTLEVKNADQWAKAVLYNDSECTKTDTGYSFTMPDCDVTLSASMQAYAEVKENGIAKFAETNVTTIAKNASYNYSDILKDEWGLDVALDSAYMASLKSEVISSDAAVIPQSAISVKSYSKDDLKMGSVNGFEIVKAKVLIDTTQIGVGTAWLTMHFENGNVSPKEEGTLVVKVTVCEYGQIELASMQETIVLDVSGAGLSDSLYTVRVCDGDYVDGSSVPAAKDYTLTAEDGKMRISFDYTVGHEYWIRVSAGEADDYNTPLSIGAKETEGAKYTGDTTLPGTGSLTFTLADQVLELVVTAA